MADTKPRILTSAAIAACVLFGYGDALGAPTGGEVTGGTGTISQPNSTTTRIDQASNKLSIDWSTFDVAANETVQFVQPSAQAIALNRILDQKASQIFGAIDANGRVFLINPNGVVFGRDSHINVAGLVASSLDMSSADFMAGRYSLEARDGSEGGLVANHGVIETTPGGFVVLTGGAVINDGVVLAELGSITLAAGHKATLDFQGDGMLLFEVDQALTEKLAGVDAAVTNTGQLIANGGRILLTAQAASDVYSRVVNNEGIARANRIDDSGGVIRLVGAGGETSSSGLLDASGAGDTSSGGTVDVLGDDVTVTGLINADASGTGNGGNVTVIAEGTTTFAGHISARGGAEAGDGGFAEVSGQHLAVSGHADLRAPNGDNGGLLLDPGSVAIVDGGNTGPAVAMDTFNDAWIEAQLANSDVTILTTASTNGGAQDITVDSDVSIDWGADNANELTLNAGHDITLGGVFDMQNDGTLTLLFGQAGAATLDLGGATLTGTANATGGAGQDTLVGDTAYTITGANTGSSASLASWSSIGNLTGTAGDDTFTVTGGGLNGTLDGLDGNDTFVGQTNYTIDGADSGSSNRGGAPTVIDWTNIENLTGTAGVDTFTFTAALTGTASGLGNNDTFNVNDGGSAGTFNGGAGSDEVTYEANTGPVTVSIASLVGIETLTGSDDASDELQGTGGADTFATSATDAGTVGGVAYSSFETLNGLGGADIFNLNNNVTLDVVGGAGTDTFNLGAGVQIGGILVGGSESDTLVAVGGGGPNVWTINAADAGTLGARQFMGMENLTGNGSVDNFTFTAALTGTASGLGQNDTFTINNGGSAGAFNGGAGTDTQTYAGSAGPVTISIANLVAIETLVGSASANDVLQGTSSADTFTTAGAGAGNVGGVNYSSFENLNGLAGSDTLANDTTYSITGANSGTSTSATTWSNIENLTGTAGADTFTFTAALSGTAAGLGAGDTFTINDGGSAGTFDGGAGTDTQTYVGNSGPVTISIADLVAIENLVGSAASDVLQGTSAADTFATSAFGNGTVGGVTYTSFENLDGLAGTDTLANDGAYTIAGGNSGTSTSTTTWSNIENLTGTTGADTFTFGAGGSLSGLINGLAGTDVADYSAATGPMTVTFGTSVVGVETLNGGGAGFTLAGGSAWTIATADSGTVDGITFVNWANATGTAGADTFTVAGGTLSGTANGAGGTDTLSGDSAYSIIGTNNGTGLAVAAWSNIENLTGTAGADTFAVAGGTLSGTANGAGGSDSLSGNSTYTITGADVGSANAVTNWSSIENLTGTGGADTFTVSGGTLSGTADGAAGVDTLAGATTYTINGPDSGSSNAVALWTNIENLTGTGGADTFTVVSGGSLGGTIDGLVGGDTLTGPNAATTWSVTGTGTGSLSGGTALAFNNLETLQGGSAADAFGLSGNIVANGGDGDDTFALTSGTGAIAGEGGTDTVAAAGAFTVVGSGGGTAAGRTLASMELLSGTGANDTVTGPGAATTWTLAGLNGGSATGGATIAFEGMDGLVSGGGADAFTLDPTFQGSMNIDGSPTSTMVISSTGSPGDDWNFDSFDTVDFGPGIVLNIGTFSLTSVVTQAGTGTTPLVWTAGMDVTLGGTTVNTLFFIGNTPDLPFTKTNDFAVTNVSLANAALNDNALTANNNAVSEVDWAQFDPNLRLFDVNNPGVKLPADQVVDELALFWFDDEEEDEIDIAQAISPRTLVGLESRRN